MKSLAHPDWPYTGTPWEWRGFAKEKSDRAGQEDHMMDMQQSKLRGVYQKQSFGPELK